MNGDIVNNRRLIKNVDAVQRFRDILFYQIRISISAIFLYYPITFLLTMLTIDPFKLLLWLIAAAAILFTPYIFYVLIKERKFGWIITFFVMTIIPFLLVHFLFIDALFHDAIILIPLAFFYFYCFLIKYDVDRWLSDYYTHQEYLRQEKERAERMKQNLFLE